MVDKSKFQNLNIEASKLGFGCMRFPCNIDGTINESETEKMLDHALDNGITYFDTAWMYHNGQSETILGKLMKKHPRNSYYLATKLPPWNIKCYDDVSKIFNTQLEKLQTDYIDFYLFHALDKNSVKTIENYDIIAQMEEYKRQGKIKYLGFSFHDDLETFKNIVNMYDKWDFCQIQLNYMDTETQQGIEGYKLLTDMGIPVIIMEPVKGGRLADFSNEISQPFTEYNPSASAASWAHRWVASLNNVKVVLSGMSSMEQLCDNINTYTDFKPLNTEEYSVIDMVKEKLMNVPKINCTSCQYCMPCPAGVNIPRNFGTYNEYFMYKNKQGLLSSVSFIKNDNQDAARCTECGVCVSKCPQGIDIPVKLKEMNQIIEALSKP